VPVPECDHDHIDRLIERLEPLRHVDIDLEVEGIVDRIASINKRIKRGMEATLAQYGLTHPDFQVLGTLRLWRSDHRSSPGELAADMELSSGAMTSRLDRLEEAGYIRRLRDPDDRRGVVVELTPEGERAWDEAASVQGRREAFFASTLSKKEQQQLNALLRKLMLAFETRESAQPEPAESAPPSR
jgi:DNA-binding MarR family transcriptional regulator